MTANKFTLETPYCKITLLKLPQQVKKLVDLPNWYITIAKKNEEVLEKVYLNIQHDLGANGMLEMADIGRDIMGQLEALLAEKDFRFTMAILPTSPLGVSEKQRIAKELFNFFQRRGRHTKSAIESASTYEYPYTGTKIRDINTITLALDSDAVFKTMHCPANYKHRYKCISGSVNILGQHQNFELSHPLFNLSLMMTASDARKNIVAGLRKTFPFMRDHNTLLPVMVQDWAFDSHVHGK